MQRTRAPLIAAAALAAACSSACSGDNEPKPIGWQVVQQDLAGAILRVWGTSSRDVYAVGADPMNEGSLMLHFDGTKWTKLDTGTTGDLWWIDRVAEDDVRAVGEAGLILRYRPSDGSFERLTAPEPITLFGAWGSSSTDVWYVGGIPGERGVVWHDDGTAIAPMAEVPTPTTAAAFKVHGFADGRAWIVGELGLASLWNGASFDDTPTGVIDTLFTVHGVTADRVYAVGGFGSGRLLAWNGTQWIDESPAGSGNLNAIWAVDRERAYAAGFNGSIYERRDGAWIDLGQESTLQDFHAVWIDEKGGIWASGGLLAADPPRDGVLVHYGEEIATGL